VPSAFLDRRHYEPAASTVVIRHNSEECQGRLSSFAHAAASADGIKFVAHRSVAARKKGGNTLAGE
jgi:hypothetical protein